MIRRLWHLATWQPPARIAAARLDLHISRCIVCGRNEPDPANLLAVCRPCVDLIEAHDRGDLRDPDAKTRPHTRTRPPGPPYPDPSTLRRPA